MKHRQRIAIAIITSLLAAPAFAANPFLGYGAMKGGFRLKSATSKMP
jgi:hypothetical protein